MTEHKWLRGIVASYGPFTFEAIGYINNEHTQVTSSTL